MAWRQKVEDEDHRAGAIVVNTNRPLDEVVDELLKITRGYS